jgi:hypothetical protein
MASGLLNGGNGVILYQKISILHMMTQATFLFQMQTYTFGEPFSYQQQLPKLNYADRDWYNGVTATNSTYISAVFMSASIHAPAIAIATPVYALQDNNNNNQKYLGPVHTYT